MKALFASDLHGIHYAYEQLFEIAAQKKVDLILIGGDITPKRVAVKLADYTNEEDYEKEDDLVKLGQVFSLESLTEMPVRNTYTSSLQTILNLNKKLGPDKIQRELEEEGYIVHPIKNAFYNLEAMLEDNIMIDRLIDLFSKETKGRLIQPFPLTERDYWTLEALLDSLREIEYALSEETKNRKAQGWNMLIKTKREGTHYRFEDLCMSSNLINFFRFRGHMNAMEEECTKLKAANIHGDEIVNEYFDRVLDSALERLHLAREMVQIYEDSSLKELARVTSVNHLINLSTQHEVYVEGQKKFISTYLRESLKKFKEANPKVQVCLILGNDDVVEVKSEIQALQNENLLIYLEQNVVQLDKKLFLAGYPYVRPSRGNFYDGWQKNESAIAKDLEALAQLSEPENTIYLCHTPPFGGSLDIASNKEHLGSVALKEFIEKYRPRAVLSGHTHEAHLMSGKVQETYGRTICYNVGGNHSRKELKAVIINLENPQEYELVK